MRLFTAGLVSSLVVTSALFSACSNDSGGSGSGGTGGSSGSGGSSTTGGSAGSGESSGNGGSGAVAPGGAGEAGSTDASGGSSATGGNAGEAGATGTEASGGTSDTGGSGGTGGGGTGGDATGGTGGTGAHGGTGGSGGTGGGKGGTPTPNIGCMGSVATESSHELTSCGMSISRIDGSGQAQFTLGLQGKDASNGELTLTLQFTDVPSAATYTFDSGGYANFDSSWYEGTTLYTADAHDGIVGLGSLSVEIDTIDGPFTAGSTTFYTATGSIGGMLQSPPAPGSAALDITF